MIAREPCTFSPPSKRSAGTDRFGKRSRVSSAWVGINISTVSYGIDFSSSAFFTASQGCDECTT